MIYVCAGLVTCLIIAFIINIATEEICSLIFGIISCLLGLAICIVARFIPEFAEIAPYVKSWGIPWWGLLGIGLLDLLFICFSNSYIMEVTLEFDEEWYLKITKGSLVFFSWLCSAVLIFSL